MSFLGLDIGTTGCKAAVFSEAGNQLALAYREYTILNPQPGWVELDSQQVFDLIKETIGEVALRVTEDPVKALCISSMGEAVTPVSNDRRILGNCILSSDIRGAEYIDELKQDLDQKAFYAVNPNILGVNYSLPKLLWLKNNEPELFEKTDKFLLWGDLVTFLLGAEPVTSFSLANRTLLFDISQEDWSDQLLQICGLNRDILPIPKPAGSIAGTVSDSIAQELNLPKNVAIVVGGHDQCCNSLGAGICSAGRAVCGIGTFECITPSYDFIPTPDQMLPWGLNVEHHVIPNLYVSFIYNQSGSVLRWFRNTFASADGKLLADNEDIYEVLSREIPEKPTDLLVLPHFEMTGPPKFITETAGAIIGLKLSTTRGEILKSIMECVTLYFVESVDSLETMGIDTSEFVATGGGAKSDQWLQIKADIFGVPFVRPKITEAGILGTVILAGVATDTYASPNEAISQLVKMDRTFEPNMDRHDQYRGKYTKFRQLFPAIQNCLI